MDIEQVHKPIPYHHIVSWVIDSQSPIYPSHVFILRLTSIMFTCIGIGLLFAYFPKNKSELGLLALLIISNPFLHDISIFFRYYSYYFMASVLAFIILVIGYPRWQLNSRISVGILGSWLSLSLLYVLNALQFGMVVLYDLINTKIKTRVGKTMAIGIIVFAIGIVIFKPSLIWQLLAILNISGHGAVDISSAQVLGLTKATLIKPIYAVFQMIFGPAIAPTYSMSVGVIFILGS